MADPWGEITQEPLMGVTQLAVDPESTKPSVEPETIDEVTPEEESTQAAIGRLVAAVLEWIAIAAGSLFLALLIRTVLVQSYYIPSGSMQNTLTVNDRVLVNKLSYEFSSPSHGDVVVFHRPPNLSGSMEHLIKRVIAVDGDIVEGRNGQVLVNGVAINEPYLEQGVLTSTFAPTEVPPGRLWVMGDNRTNSADSRVFGTIQVDSVVGRTFVQIWPIQGFEFL